MFLKDSMEGGFANSKCIMNFMYAYYEFSCVDCKTSNWLSSQKIVSDFVVVNILSKDRKASWLVSLGILLLL